MDWYNGFSPTERARRGSARARREAPAHILQPPCAMCGDPQPARIYSHAEDYAEPYRWDPPASYPLCSPCHKRLHNRFRAPERWRSYLAFLRRGFYGREVSGDQLRAHAGRGDAFAWPLLAHEAPKREGPHAWWWESLTMDPRSLREGPKPRRNA